MKMNLLCLLIGHKKSLKLEVSWDKSRCMYVYVCKRCGKEKNEYNHTRVESGHRIDEKGRTWESHETTYKCSVCGDETKEHELVYTDW